MSKIKIIEQTKKSFTEMITRIKILCQGIITSRNQDLTVRGNVVRENSNKIIINLSRIFKYYENSDSKQIVSITLFGIGNENREFKEKVNNAGKTSHLVDETSKKTIMDELDNMAIKLYNIIIKKLNDEEIIKFLKHININVSDFIKENNLESLEVLPIETTKGTLEPPKEPSKEPQDKTTTEYEFTIYYVDGRPLCGNKFKPKKDQPTYKTIDECWKAVNAGKFGFNDEKIAKLIEEFWLNKDKVPLTLNKQNTEIIAYADHYSGELEKLKSNTNAKEIEIGSKLIKHYKEKFKYVIIESKKDKTKICQIRIPKDKETSYNTQNECDMANPKSS